MGNDFYHFSIVGKNEFIHFFSFKYPKLNQSKYTAGLDSWKINFVYKILHRENRPKPHLSFNKWE